MTAKLPSELGQCKLISGAENGQTCFFIWPNLSSICMFLKKSFLYLFLEMPHLSHEIPVAEHLAWYDSLANYGSSTTFRHILLSLNRFSLHIKTLKRVKILLCTTGIASQKRQIMVLVTTCDAEVADLEADAPVLPLKV
jgi:hypothetical protein